MPLTVLRDSTKREGWISDSKPHTRRRMTEREFVEWADSTTRAEWVDGEVIMMLPVSRKHDTLQWWLRSLLQLFADERELGEVKGPEFVVRLPKQRRRRTPDVLFVAAARAKIVQANQVEGAPDLIIEVVSPESVSRDWRDKFLEYERAGVREYWVIDPFSKRMEAYLLVRSGKYQRLEEVEGKLSSSLLKGFYIRSRWVFAEKPPRVTTALREMGLKLG